MSVTDLIAVQQLTLSPGKPTAMTAAIQPLSYSCTDGMVSLSTAHGIWLITGHQLIVLSAETPHEITTYGTVDVEQLMLPDNRLVSESLPMFYRISELIRSLINQAKHLPSADCLTQRDHLVLELLSEEVCRYPCAALWLPLPTGHPLLKQLCESFIRQPNIHQPMEEWIERLQVSRRTFARHFERYTGKRFSEWIQLACLIHALPRLCQKETIQQVSQSIGFEHSGTFSLMCKRLTGRSHSEYLSRDRSDNAT